MARSPIRKSLEHLIKKVEALENQSFAQQLHVDELENKLSKAEEVIRQMKEDPFGIGKLTTTPFVQTVQPPPWNPPVLHYPIAYHICNPGPSDSTGLSHCTICGTTFSPVWTTTCTSSGPASQSSSDVEPTLDLDISWVIPEDK